MHRLVLPLLLVAALGVAEAPASLTTEIGPVEAFQLTDQDGNLFSSDQLHGKVWIAHFFYTACTQGCDKTSATMARLQERFRGKKDVALVSISVNPELDSPSILAEVAQGYHAEKGQWWFLTGPEAKVYGIVKNSFKFAVERFPSAKPNEQVTHTFNVAVIDRDGNIVGYVDARDPANVEPLVARVRQLAGRRYVLPAINSLLNGTSAVLLVLGYISILRRREKLHKIAMLSALCVSTAFLALYLYFHFAIQHGEATRFAGPLPVKIAYWVILGTHTILAITVAPLAFYVTIQGLRDDRRRHVAVARWTFPIWLYVSVTGVVVYVMLYQMYPPY
jgi:protein SCO1/2/putative membrane protein